MRSGDIIVVMDGRAVGSPRSRKAVVLRVTKDDIRKGADALKPGLYAFYGFWYGEDTLSIKSYGKLIPARGRVVGRIHKGRPGVARRFFN